MCFLFSSPHSSFWCSCTTQWLYKVTAQLQQCVQGKERRLLIRINILWHVWWAWWGDKAGRGPPLQSDLRTAWSQTGNVNSVPVWWDSFTSQWGSRQSVCLRLHRQRLWFCTLHETHFAFGFVTKKKKTEECTLRHKFCNALYCRGSVNISYMKALQGFTLVLNFKSDVGCFSEQRPNNVEASWENMQGWLPIKEKNICVKSQDL